ncbi:glutathione ABC transporter permease GsiC [Methanosarcinales archaeon]|nr:ABC transporter permease [Candidatus Desulfofervidus sp.]MCW3130957.1 ABC transporter permease [Methanophagales archaeon]MCW3138321.1 ABC transporter permease [Methanophagales archaeon]MCW3139254.1 ABC transporter permease [Methanophagales archaeon]RLG32444.1 MAG: glutathione ABC transporter permease GsiC [Methanosarcinales archaeon]
MLGYIAKRTAIAVFVVFATSALTFFLLSLIPGETAVTIIQRVFVGDVTYNPSQAEIEATEQIFHLGNPLWMQYLYWLNNALHGNFGTSYISGRPVLSEILVRLPATVELAIAATILSLVVAVPLGMISAARQNSKTDYLSMASATFFIAMPNFWLGLILILLFSLHLDLLPVAGYGGLDNLILPAITLGAGMMAVTMRLMRSSVLEVLRLDYITTARAKGMDEKRIMYRHVLKNAMIPVITVAGLQLGYLLGGTVIVETIFAWPGIGKLLIDSIDARDIPIIQGCVVFIAIMFSLLNLLVDLSYYFLDPRIKYEKV